jgi:uncharacterized protein with HEPN domain
LVGEAVRWLPEEFTARHSAVPWSQIAGLRNRIVHDYFGLDSPLILNSQAESQRIQTGTAFHGASSTR